MTPIFDIHCHPSLKVYLCDADFSAAHKPQDDFVPGTMHYDLPGMREGNVKVIISYQYVPEQGLKHMPKTAWLFKLLEGIHLSYAEKFERNDEVTNVFEQAMGGIRAMDKKVADAPPEFNAVIPKNLADFDTALSAGKTIILHALEGAHQIGRNLGGVQAYLDNLAAYKAAGVCVITLGHFFPNEVTDSGGGIPPGEAKFLGYNLISGNPPGLTPEVGEAVINWCQDNGMIIDLVHSSELTRNRVYEILDARNEAGQVTRPVIFSHTGVRIMVDPYMLSDSDHLILPSLDEVLRIHKYGGTLGMILMNYWQNGDEQQDTLLVHDKGLKNVVATMKWIREATGDVKIISIGTDLDGFTTVPSDIPHIAFIDRLRQAMADDFSAQEIEDICFNNALRVLRAGWS
ncbi:dipeptidase [Mucilaginibacter sp. L3T2-6]|uniref:dipeptidase n=1 Tax=Mucilaginibacter sp. L3T2-6 TaxID=3062491 RepID=UPI0026769F84|nr:membrane dipeptidase [Mucilaginibacter sp. L3T2-6]MDO3644961.1 membrane dipeptidase [Mucilaginibacter sp. L3T2-6]MDV6217413.1 membrane dipeptidase [Mucilaginibacter sp. L3T2-6]